MDGRHSYTDDISICCSLSVLLCYCPQKTQSEKLLFWNRKTKPQHRTQTRKIPENLHLQQPKAIFFSLLNLDWEAGRYVRHLWELQVESWGLVSKVTHSCVCDHKAPPISSCYHGHVHWFSMTFKKKKKTPGLISDKQLKKMLSLKSLTSWRSHCFISFHYCNSVNSKETQKPFCCP